MDNLDLVVRARSIDIGGQTYPYSNISRVGTWEYQKPWLGHAVKAGCLGMLGLPLVVAELFVIALPVLLAAGFFGWRAYNAFNFHYYSLRLETAGVHSDAIFSKDRQAIIDLREQVVDLIDSPPETGMIINLPQNTFVSGDQINVVGDHNTGKRGI
jgi:hypothetical protein